MGRFTARIRGIGLFADKVPLWRVAGIGVAAGLLTLAGIAAELRAQTVFPSQVTPPSLRPPATAGGVISSPGTEDLRVLPDKKTKKKRLKARDRTNGSAGSTDSVR